MEFDQGEVLAIFQALRAIAQKHPAATPTIERLIMAIIDQLPTMPMSKRAGEFVDQVVDGARRQQRANEARRMSNLGLLRTT